MQLTLPSIASAVQIRALLPDNETICDFLFLLCFAVVFFCLFQMKKEDLLHHHLEFGCFQKESFKKIQE